MKVIVNVFFIGSALLRTCTLAITEADPGSRIIQLCFRCVFSVVYMKSHVSSWLTLLNTLVACWTHWRNAVVGEMMSCGGNGTLSLLVVSELVVLLVTTSCCVVTERWFADLAYRSEGRGGYSLSLPLFFTACPASNKNHCLWGCMGTASTKITALNPKPKS